MSGSTPPTASTFGAATAAAQAAHPGMRIEQFGDASTSKAVSQALSDDFKKAEGLSILVVDKTLSELLPVADRCVILENGKSVWQGTSADLTADVQDRYLGV